MYIIDKDKIGKTYYTYSDHLGSIIALTNATGAIEQEQSFDPWGRKRNPNNWSYDGIPEFKLLDRGYTGHEHLPEFGLINMNGRLYDPLLGRILSPDPFLQDPSNTQNFNRYSYCFNNPLKYTDPSGYLTSANFWDYFDYLWNMGTDGSPEARSSGGHVKGFTDNGSTNGGGGDASGTGDEGSSGSSEHGSDRLTSSFWNTKIGQAILKLCGYNIMQSYAGAGVYVTFNTYNTSSSDYFNELGGPITVVDPSGQIIYHDDSSDNNIYLSTDGVRGADGNTNGMSVVGQEKAGQSYPVGRYVWPLNNGANNVVSSYDVTQSDALVQDNTVFWALLGGGAIQNALSIYNFFTTPTFRDGPGAASKGFSKDILPEGFNETKEFGYQHGQKVYEYNGNYFSKDIDSHNGGVWKVFKAIGRKLKRIGTADETLTIFKN